MSYYKVVYDKLFPYAPYLNERIGVEILVEKCQSPMEALEQARSIVHDFRNKHIQVELAHQYEPTTEKIPDIQKDRLEEDVIKGWVEDIDKCESLEQLNSWSVLSRSKPELQKVYFKKLKQLKK